MDLLDLEHLEFSALLLVMRHFQSEVPLSSSWSECTHVLITPTTFKRKQGKTVFMNRTNFKNLFSPEYPKLF